MPALHLHYDKLESPCDECNQEVSDRALLPKCLALCDQTVKVQDDVASWRPTAQPQVAVGAVAWAYHGTLVISPHALAEVAHPRFP
jgi:hypothetical protein